MKKVPFHWGERHVFLSGPFPGSQTGFRPQPSGGLDAVVRRYGGRSGHHDGKLGSYRFYLGHGYHYGHGAGITQYPAVSSGAALLQSVLLPAGIP